jgi:hypothetical protein
MTRKIILLLCGLGILFYSYKIYHLKNTITLFPSAASAPSKTPGADQAAPMMRFKFTLETNNVDLMEACRKFFNDKRDVIALSPHPKEEGKAILTIERLFPVSDLPVTLDLNKTLKARGCLNGDKDVFAMETAKQ